MSAVSSKLPVIINFSAPSLSYSRIKFIKQFSGFFFFFPFSWQLLFSRQQEVLCSVPVLFLLLQAVGGGARGTRSTPPLRLHPSHSSARTARAAARSRVWRGLKVCVCLSVRAPVMPPLLSCSSPWQVFRTWGFLLTFLLTCHLHLQLWGQSFPTFFTLLQIRNWHQSLLGILLLS